MYYHIGNRMILRIELITYIYVGIIFAIFVRVLMKTMIVITFLDRGTINSHSFTIQRIA